MSKRIDYDNFSFAELAREVTKAIGRDEVRKRRVLALLPNSGFALDAEELAQMSGHELAVRALKQFGLKVPTESDAVEALDYFLEGRNQRARLNAGMKGSALDGAPSFLTKYLEGK